MPQLARELQAMFVVGAEPRQLVLQLRARIAQRRVHRRIAAE